MAFKKLGISNEVLKTLEEAGFEKPSPIQEKSIPLILEGKDVIAGASTGSGKTLAFASGILQTTEKGKGIQALVLAPTRELAEQVSQAFSRFAKYKPYKITTVYGGVSIEPQIKDLKTAEIVIGTPGRILDHIKRETINLENLKTLVLDEADRMLDMGFIDDVEEIINECPGKRQTLLFSATITPDIAQIAARYLKNPVEVSVESQVDPSKLKQIFYDTPDNYKFSLLVHLLEHEAAKLVMVFCNTRKNVDFVAKNLMFAGIDALAIHGGFSQQKRTRTMDKFNSSKVQVLVCTDVAARGLDIKGVSHVYNYDIPKEAKEYIHRIGRTARAGKEGIAINLVASRDYENFSNVQNRNTDLKIEQVDMPRIDRVMIRWKETPNRFDRDSRGGSSYGRGRDSHSGPRNGDSRGRSSGNHHNSSSRDGFRGSRNTKRNDFKRR